MPQKFSRVLPLPGAPYPPTLTPSRAQSMRNATRSRRIAATRSASPRWPSTVSSPAAASRAITAATAGETSASSSSGRAHTRIEPPWVGSSSTSTSRSPPLASARWAVSTV